MRIGPTNSGRISLSLRGLGLTAPPTDTPQATPVGLYANRDNRSFAFGGPLAATVTGSSAGKTVDTFTSNPLAASSPDPIGRMRSLLHDIRGLVDAASQADLGAGHAGDDRWRGTNIYAHTCRRIAHQARFRHGDYRPEQLANRRSQFQSLAAAGDANGAGERDPRRPGRAAHSARQ
jgi:hypothetical protein